MGNRSRWEHHRQRKILPQVLLVKQLEFGLIPLVFVEFLVSPQLSSKKFDILLPLKLPVP